MKVIPMPARISLYQYSRAPIIRHLLDSNELRTAFSAATPLPCKSHA
jgi:hypothetical protein